MTRCQVLAFELKDFDRFVAIFGEAVASATWEDIYQDLTSLKERLLSRHEIESPVACSQMGRSHCVFRPADGFMVDWQEQLDSILSTGKHLVRQLLQEHLGEASGLRQPFQLVIAELEYPFKESQLVAAILTAMEQAGVEAIPEKDSVSPYAPVTCAAFEQVLQDKELQTHFQAIVELPSRRVVGYEALTRGPKGSEVERPDKLFGSAGHFGLTVPLELLCIERGLEWVARIPENCWVAFNVGPSALLSERFDALLAQAEEQGLMNRLVFELTEHLPLDSCNAIQARIEALRSKGVRLSLDDTGCGFFDLTTVEQLHPAIVKLCITVIKRIGNSDAITEDIRQTRIRVAELGGQTLGEGVETEAQVDVLNQCQVPLAQGFLFHRPEPAEEIFC